MSSKGSRFCGMKLIYQIYPDLFKYILRMNYIKISTFRSGLYGKYVKVSCIGISDEIKEKYESMHMKKTKTTQRKSPRKWGSFSELFFHYILECFLKAVTTSRLGDSHS